MIVAACLSKINFQSRDEIERTVIAVSAGVVRFVDVCSAW